jgi:hypothetical protein
MRRAPSTAHASSPHHARERGGDSLAKLSHERAIGTDVRAASVAQGDGTITVTDCAGIVYLKAFTATAESPAPATGLAPPAAVMV